MNLYNKALYNQALPGTLDGGSSNPQAVTLPMSSSPAVNSTTYIDLLGILAGLERMSGESSDEFAARISKASVVSRGADYIGLMDELALQFGLNLRELISVERVAVNETDQDLTCDITVDLAGVRVTWNGELKVSSPLMILGPEDFWEWRRLSDVATDLAAIPGLQAKLLVDDGPAFQLVRQSNVLTAIGEAIDGTTVRLAHGGLVMGSEWFNQPIPKYAIQSDSVLSFTSPMLPGTRVTYKYRVWPYSLIGSPVFIMSLLDPNLGTLAVTPEGKLVYQMREFLQELVGKDRSYWAL